MDLVSGSLMSDGFIVGWEACNGIIYAAIDVVCINKRMDLLREILSIDNLPARIRRSLEARLEVGGRMIRLLALSSLSKNARVTLTESDFTFYS